MILDQSDPNTLLLGSRGTISRVPDTDLKVALAKLPESVAPRLAFMPPEHHLVRNLVVRELPYESGRPMKVDRLAATLGLPLAGVRTIVEDLERLRVGIDGIRSLPGRNNLAHKTPPIL